MEESNVRLEKLQELEQVESKIVEMLQYAGQSLHELSKDKPIGKTVESNGNNFVKSLKSIDEILSQQILHLHQISTGASHEGTHYDCAKEREIISRCLNDLEDQLQRLIDARTVYLSEIANEGSIILDEDTGEPMIG